MRTGQSDLATTSGDRADTARQRAALVRLLLEVVELPKTGVSRLLIREIEVANELLESGDGRYAEQLINGLPFGCCSHRAFSIREWGALRLWLSAV